MRDQAALALRTAEPGLLGFTQADGRGKHPLPTSVTKIWKLSLHPEVKGPGRSTEVI